MRIARTEHKNTPFRKGAVIETCGVYQRRGWAQYPALSHLCDHSYHENQCLSGNRYRFISSYPPNLVLDDEYIASSDIEDPPPDFLEWNGRTFRKSMECDNEYIQVSYASASAVGTV